MAHEIHRLAPRRLQNLLVAQDIRHPQRRQPRLLRAEELARPAQLQVHLRDQESIVGIHQRADAFLRRIAHALRDQDAIALRRAASHASTPASITVVETRILISPFLKRSIVDSFSSDGSRPCINPTAIPGNTSCDKCSCIFSAAFMALVSDSSITGYTTYACRPSSICFFTKL